MKQDQPETAGVDASNGWLSRERALALVLVLATLITAYLCYLIIHPLLPAIAWALALALVAYPAYEWLRRKIGSDNVAASITMTLVALVIVAPTVFVAQQLVVQVREGVSYLNEEVKAVPWDQFLEHYPRLAPALEWFERSITPGDELNKVAGTVSSQLSSFLTGSLWAVTQLLIMLYILFYFIRDHREGVNLLRSLVPLSDGETDEVFARVEDTIYATIYGTVVVGLVQGVVAWAMFWFLGLSTPLLWAALTAMMAIVPVLGPFVIWMPAAIILALQGGYSDAIKIAIGGVVIALIGHFLYPTLVGHRLRLHPVLVFFAFLGGLAVFGAAGLILGPTVLALTEALVNVWQRRTAEGSRPSCDRKIRRNTGPNLMP